MTSPTNVGRVAYVKALDVRHFQLPFTLRANTRKVTNVVQASYWKTSLLIKTAPGSISLQLLGKLAGLFIRLHTSVHSADCVARRSMVCDSSAFGGLIIMSAFNTHCRNGGRRMEFTRVVPRASEDSKGTARHSGGATSSSTQMTSKQTFGGRLRNAPE